MTLSTHAALAKDMRSADRAKVNTMQPRHYAMLAGILNEMTDYGCPRGALILRFADKLEAGNPNFDRERFKRFLAACGYVEG